MSHFVKVSVICREVFGTFTGEGDYGNDKIVDVIAWLKKMLKEVPEEYREGAVLAVQSVGGYEGEHHTEFEIYYYRPESSDEERWRVDRERRNNEALLQRERAEYQRLKRQFGA